MNFDMLRVRFRLAWILVLLTLNAQAAGHLSDQRLEKGLEKVREWVMKAHGLAGFLGDDLRWNVPYVIVAGDQGVGKSTTINRLLNTPILPMRSKQMADSDSPQTTIATVYHMKRVPGSDGSVAKVVTSAAGRKGCEEQVVEVKGLASKLAQLQSDCFGQNQFDLESTITVVHESANATEISIVDLPGIKQAGADKDLTKQLTAHWLGKYTTSVVLAVLVAERQLQQSIVGMMEAHPAKYSRRAIAVVTKPHSIPSDSRKVLNLIRDPKIRQLTGGRVIVLKSADTSSETESSWGLEEQVTQETAWFRGNPLYSHMSKHWGIQQLIQQTQDIYLQSACKQIPMLQEAMQQDRKRVEQELRRIPEARFTSTEELFAELAQAAKELLERDVRTGPLNGELYKVYMAFKALRVHYTPAHAAKQGLPEYGMDTFSEKHAFLQGWIAHAKSLAGDVTRTMQRAVHRAVTRSTQELFSSGLQGEISSLFYEDLARCDGAEQTLERVIAAQRFDVTFQTELAHPEKLQAFIQRATSGIPMAILQVVIQMCVYEPIRDMRARMWATKVGSLRESLLRALNWKSLQEDRKALMQMEQAYRELLSDPLECATMDSVENDGEDANGHDNGGRDSNGNGDGGGNTDKVSRNLQSQDSDPVGGPPNLYSQDSDPVGGPPGPPGWKSIFPGPLR